VQIVFADLNDWLVKGTVRVILVTLYVKMAMPDIQQYS